jgi:tRNA(adenine34) deaminase
VDDHRTFMELALREAERCLAAGEFPVGCVIVYQGRVVATGHRFNSTGASNELDHAEMVALRRLLSSEAASKLAEVTVYSTMEPCLMCYATLLVNGVRRFVYAYEDVMGGGTNLPLAQLAPLYRDLQPMVLGAVLRRRSLALFKQFFSSPGCAYLAGSLLAEYTLAQADNEQPPTAIFTTPGRS